MTKPQPRIPSCAASTCHVPAHGGPCLSPAARMFFAALTSRSCSAPHSEHSHCLTTSCLRPLGPVAEPQLEHTRVVNFSSTTRTSLPAHWPLYCSCVLS